MLFHKEMENNILHITSPPAPLQKRGEKQPLLPHESGCFKSLAFGEGFRERLCFTLKCLIVTMLLSPVQCVHAQDNYVPARVLLEVKECFPGLDGARITLKHCAIRTTLNCRPRLFSTFFNRKTKRKYVIRVNSKPRNGICYDSIPAEALRGLWAHELAHVVDYASVGACGVMKRGLWYLSPGRKEMFEKSIDLLAIRHGAGTWLLEWSCYVQERSGATDEYKAYKRRYYLEPGEIEQELKKVP